MAFVTKAAQAQILAALAAAHAAPAVTNAVQALPIAPAAVKSDDQKKLATAVRVLALLPSVAVTLAAGHKPAIFQAPAWNLVKPRWNPAGEFAGFDRQAVEDMIQDLETLAQSEGIALACDDAANKGVRTGGSVVKGGKGLNRGTRHGQVLRLARQTVETLRAMIPVPVPVPTPAGVKTA